MSDVEFETPPEGFEQLPSGLGFADALSPLYRLVTDDKASFGLVVREQHANTMGICHGGVLMTLADMTAAVGANMAKGVFAGSPTVNLAIDYISSARLGEWVYAEAERVNVKRLFGFSSGTIYNARGVVARFNGTFYFPEHKGMWRNGTPGDGVMVGAGDREKDGD